MSRKNIIDSFVMFDAVDSSTNQSTLLNPTNVKHLDNCGIQVRWANTVDGTLFVSVSNDERSPTHWTRLDFGSSIVLNNTETSHAINMHQLPFSWIALEFVTNPGSTGSITATLTSKMV